MTHEPPFNQLTPDFLLDAVESAGFVTDGRMLALNSYENRVYQVGLEGSEPVVVKFYRTGRWTRDQILEEHQFVLELVEAELPVVAPLVNAHAMTLHECKPYVFAVFPRRGGRTPELDFDALHSIGQTLGKLHSVGSLKPFKHRQRLDIVTF